MVCSKNKIYWLAFSGGVDSQVLLHMLLQQAIKPNLIHVHHGLSPNADAWLEFCQQVANQHNLSFFSKHLAFKPGKDDSLEALAREARYSCFAELMAEDDVLLTAHHADDQAETVLLQLMRGSGPKGLAAMPLIKPFAKGFHARPLLAVRRDEVLAYAREYQLDWVEDESNDNLDFSRNYVRHQVMPHIQQRWPQAVTTLSRSAEHCAEAQGLLDEYADLFLMRVAGKTEDSLSQDLLLELTPAQQALVLRRWIVCQGYTLPEQSKLKAILNDVLTAAPGRQPCVSWGQVSIRRFRGELVLLSRHCEEREARRSNLNQNGCSLAKRSLATLGMTAGLGMTARQTLGQGLRYAPEELTVCYRQGGERIGVAGGYRKTLKNLLQEWAVPVWERSGLALLYWRDELVAVPGYHYDPKHQVAENEPGWVYEIQKSPPGRG